MTSSLFAVTSKTVVQATAKEKKGQPGAKSRLAEDCGPCWQSCQEGEIGLSGFAETLAFFVIPAASDRVAIASPVAVIICFVPILLQLVFQPIVPI